VHTIADGSYCWSARCVRLDSAGEGLNARALGIQVGAVRGAWPWPAPLHVRGFEPTCTTRCERCSHGIGACRSGYHARVQCIEYTDRTIAPASDLRSPELGLNHDGVPLNMRRRILRARFDRSGIWRSHVKRINVSRKSAPCGLRMRRIAHGSPVVVCWRIPEFALTIVSMLIVCLRRVRNAERLGTCATHPDGQSRILVDRRPMP